MGSVKVRIVNTETGEVAWESDAMSERAAERVEDGAGINLDWSRFHTEQVPA